MSPSDPDLLQRYAETGAQEAFATLVKRHLDLVYSTARRQVRSPQLAEEIAQSVFLDLAQKAGALRHGAPLVAWLYLVTRRTAIDVIRRESRRQAREQTAYEIAAMSSPTPAWPQVEPLLDEAMESLDDTDRSAVLLRYFENRSLREIGQSLGTSEDAAQKRVSRAVDQLRSFFLKRGITVSAAGLVTDLSAQAVATAPVGLTAAITALSLSPAATATAVKIFAMTTVQKSLVGTAVTLALGAAFFESYAVSGARSELRATASDVALLSARLDRARHDGEVSARSLLEAKQRLAAAAGKALSPAGPDTAEEKEMKAWLQRVARFKQLLADTPEKSVPEIRLLNEDEWFKLGQDPDLSDEIAFARLRDLATALLSSAFFPASAAYVKDHNGRLPTEVRELKPYLKDNGQAKISQADDSMFSRYAIRYAGLLADVPVEERNAVFVEISSYDEEQDQRFVSGPAGATGKYHFNDLTPDVKAALWAFNRANPNSAPTNAADLLPYFIPALSPARQVKFLESAATLLPAAH